ncbi:MAG: phosphonate metabolism protein/1,5-bisphosphokinase (PRPP-forming) PhnN [Roseobacter sp.]|jgi:ribose 1,5-bisphosphokinase
MNSGRLIAVVGPSGVGKDSIMAGIKAAAPQIRLVRRTITRSPDAGGEVYDAVSESQFAKMVESGLFCVHWHAHGLSYGIPANVLADVQNGIDCLANFSRSALPRAAAVFPAVTVLNITAAPETIARRLVGRGRESAAEIATRLAQAAKPVPEGMDVLTIRNDGTLNETVDDALAALQPVRA